MKHSGESLLQTCFGSNEKSPLDHSGGLSSFSSCGVPLTSSGSTSCMQSMHCKDIEK